MKRVYKSVTILLLAVCISLVFDSCSSRYSSSGRYRPRKNRKCDCPAYSYNTYNITNSMFVPMQQKES